MSRKKAKTIRKFMWVDREIHGDDDVIAIHRDTLKNANRILHRAENKKQADRVFAGVMSLVGAPIDANYSATIKGLSTGDLVLLVKVGNRLARLAEAAKARLERQYQARELAKIVALDKRDQNAPKSVISNPLTNLTDSKLLWVHARWMRRNSPNVCFTSTEIENRKLTTQVKVA